MNDDNQDYEFVDHPAHYNQHPIECYQFAQWFPGNLYCAIKHLWRVGLKPGADRDTDLDKAIAYINFEIERVRQWPDLVLKALPDHPADPDFDMVLEMFDTEVGDVLACFYDAVFSAGSSLAYEDRLRNAVSYIEGMKN